MSERDVDRVVPAWNAAFPHDTLTEEGFRRIMLDDPNYEPEGVLLAEREDGFLLGFSACCLRRSLSGEDGGGSDDNFERGFLKGFWVAEGEQGQEAADHLLAAVEAYCAGAAKSELRVTEYTGPYVFPGIDVRYHRLCGMLAGHGYRDVGTIEDVSVDLRNPDLPSLLERARSRVGRGVELTTWTPDLLPAMHRFVQEGDQPQWFPVGWEKGLAKPRERALILRRNEDIVGWAQYRPSRPRSGFGPILVLGSARGRGYGSLLLLECMMRARESGAEQMWAGWANTGFYARNGWEVVRRYAIFTKDLRTTEQR